MITGFRIEVDQVNDRTDLPVGTVADAGDLAAVAEETCAGAAARA